MSEIFNEAELVSAYANKRMEKDRLSDDLKTLNAEIDMLEDKILDMLGDQGKTASARYDGLGYVTVSKPRVYASITEEKRDAAFSWLRDNGAGELIKPSINQMTLSSFVRERLEGGEEIPESINYYLKPSLKLLRE